MIVWTKVVGSQHIMDIFECKYKRCGRWTVCRGDVQRAMKHLLTLTLYFEQRVECWY